MKVAFWFDTQVVDAFLFTILAMCVGFLLRIDDGYESKCLVSPQVIVDGWGRVISLEEQIKCHDRLEFIPFQACLLLCIIGVVGPLLGAAPALKRCAA